MPESHAARWLIASGLLVAALPLTALMTALLERSGPIRMRHWVEEAGGQLRDLWENPGRFEVFRYLVNLVAKLVPIVLLGCLARALALGGVSAPWWIALVAVALVLAVTELAARSLVGSDPEEALRRITWIYRGTLALSMPLVVLCAPLVPRRMLGEERSAPADDDAASEEEVEAFIDVGTREGILEPEDRDLVWGVVDFGDTQVRSVMTPRVDIVAAPVGESLDRLAELFIESSVSRVPLYTGSIDQVAGILHIRDLLAGLRVSPRPLAATLAKPAFLVPETRLLGDLLKDLKARRQQMAIVINEWGGTEGLVTVEDLVEEIVGEIEDEYDEAEPESTLLPDGSLLLDGRAAVERLEEFFAWAPAEHSSETVGGLISGLVGYVPQAGEAVDHAGLRFEVEKADERRVLALRVRRAEPRLEDTGA
ncbi:MAG: CBS domain-containing protein [Thermoanaerobaculia bacterium]|jgi:CBS domain containing-hemolysin-like protein|nr:MAG: CBS domain-containing protein [Thermoanaerobaculia bacterium]MBZ0100987.1 CBS domain-containing protein [Thermoanaerobaculia bacterium]